MTGWIIGLGLAAVAGGMGYVRLAPSDPARWHVGLAEGTLPGNAHVFCIRPDNRYGPIQGNPKDLLARLDAIAMATPRTERLAGSAAEGRITWVTRSAVMGFPDYTTAEVLEGPSLCIVGRQRFGSEDMGVNAARIGAWVQELLGLNERPGMTGL
ncbi:MAG: DUF1499 domain-containing protein [Acetobacteraceae bacterium]|nr:MAG: DUF1499 domain-containing protein [Acetobacteraceae bacterium]